MTVRTGNHPDYGRVVFDTPPGAQYQVIRDGGRLIVQFAGNVTLAGSPAPPRNVAALQASGDQEVLTIDAGSAFHVARLGDHVVIDVFDPAAAGNDAAAEPKPAADARRGPSAASPQTLPAPPLPLPPEPPPSVPPAAPHAATAATPQAAAAGIPLQAPPSAPTATSVATPLRAPIVAASLSPNPASPVSPAQDTGQVFDMSPAPPGVVPASQPSDHAGVVAQTGVEAPTGVEVPTGVEAQTGVVAQSVPLPADTGGAAFSLALPADVGAAAFRRLGEVLIILDQPRAIDLSAIQSTVIFANARTQRLPAATLIAVTPPPGMGVALSRTPQGWTIAILLAPPRPRPLVPLFGEAAVSLALPAPGSVVAIPDPLTGGTLLVGTGQQSGQGVLTPMRTAQFALLPSLQGVVVAPLADSVVLHAVPEGFSLTVAPAPLEVTRLEADVLGDAAALTRRFDFPNLPPVELTERLAKQIAAGAEQPLLARGPYRRAAALTMISLGMDAEAEALLQLTAADDPREAGSADIAGLTGVAAMLAGRPAEAGGIDDPRLTGTDEIVLWRALHLATQDDASPQAAAALASTSPLLLGLSPGIRDKALPLAAETMVRGGAIAAAKELLARSGDLPGLGMARAMLIEATGDTKSALAAYDRLAASRDQLASARAAVHAVELRLATHQLDQRQAAEALDRLLYAWRGDRRELDLREKLADLRQQLGEWRQALILLRDSEALFPADAKAIHARLQRTFDALVEGGAADTLPPLDFVALVDENADLVPDTAQGEAMQAKLADRLMALDLPNRAGPVVDKLMRAAPAGPGRAGLGLRLATLRLHEGDVGGALAALNFSQAADLPAPLAEQCTLLRADAQAQWGDVAGAMKLLANLDSVPAAAMRADILERAKDWPGADQALTAYAAQTVPQSGELTDTARRTLLRLATAAARAGDEATLVSLRQREEARMGGGPLGDMFRLLTADPVHGTADLPRSAREVGLAKALPDDLQAMAPSVRTP